MKVKMTVREAIDLSMAILNIPVTSKIRVAASYRMAANHKKLVPHTEAYSDIRKKLIEELGRDGESGKEIDPKTMPDEFAEFIKREAELLSTTIDVDLDMVHVSKLVQPDESLPMNIIYGLSPMLIDDIDSNDT